MFCYSAARRLSLVSSAELVIDNVTGFARDRLYKRTYMLDNFCIPARKATSAERLEPFERYRIGFLKLFYRSQPFYKRCYLEQVGLEYDERILSLKVKGKLYLDGLWQSEGYFKDVEHIIRRDLRICPPSDDFNKKIATKIRASLSVAVHVRWFDDQSKEGEYNISSEYYRRALSLMEDKLPNPRYFIFSDHPEAARYKIKFPEDRTMFINHNRGDATAYADLWLMQQCKHFVTANSTFSWWGAWLGTGEEKIVLTPSKKMEGKAAWGFRGLIPPEWTKV